MEFKQPKKIKLDFTRPTFNEPLIHLPPLKEESTNIQQQNRDPSSFADDEYEGDTKSTLQMEDSDLMTSKIEENISVYLRLRPTSSEQQSDLYTFDYDLNKVIIPQSGTLTKNTEKHHTFTSILDETYNQVEVYDKTVRPILDSPFTIRGATFAGYGVSNSGKTYTILGESGESSAGMVPRAITQLFTEYGNKICEYPCVRILHDKIDVLSDDKVFAQMDAVDEFLTESKKAFKGKSRSWNYENIINEHNFEPRESANRIFVWVSMVEIYNEKITDLLSIQKGTSRVLKIFSNAGNSYVSGATWLYAPNIQQAFEILNQGLNRVSVSATGINAKSSRSHTIFTINVIAEVTPGAEFQLSSFKFCDLAGAERLKKTGNVGIQLKEASGINSSLLVLGRCLEAVFHNQSKTNKKQPDVVIPVRDSKLTLLIQSSLVGHEKFVMIVNLYPVAEFYDENLNVLKFGSIANQIVVKKAEVRKFMHQSTRYSFFNNELPSPVKNGMHNTFDASMLSNMDESELDDSFKWNKMSPESLRHTIRSQQLEINVLRKTIEEREREALIKDRDMREEIKRAHRATEEKFKARNEEHTKQVQEFHERKIDSLKQSYERKLREAYEEIDRLTQIIQGSARNRNGSELQQDDEDVVEVDDDDDYEEN